MGAIVMDTAKQREFQWHKAILNFFVFILLGLPSLFLLLFADPYQRGIYCDDESIRYPYNGYSLSSVLVASLGFGVPLIGIIIFEVWRIHMESKMSDYVPITYKVGERPIHRLLVRLYIFIGFFLYGAMMTQLIEDICKYGTGRPRPYFIAMCKPDWSKINCANHTYIYPVPCTQTDWFQNKDSRLSFPSGHAAFSFYNFVYLLLYIEARVYWTMFLPVMRAVIQFVLVAAATAISITVVSDYEHHWSDAVAGAVLGITTAIITGLFVARLFDRRELPVGNLRNEDSEVGVKIYPANPANPANRSP